MASKNDMVGYLVVCSDEMVNMAVLLRATLAVCHLAQLTVAAGPGSSSESSEISTRSLAVGLDRFLPPRP